MAGKCPVPTEKKRPVTRLFSVRDTVQGAFLVLPQYDVSHMDDDACERMAKTKDRLRVPNYLPYLQGIREGNLAVLRIAVFQKEDGRKVAVALDDEIRKRLRMAGAVAIREPYLHKLAPGS